jgi:DNA-binding CsgD family transcriptional regulator
VSRVDELLTVLSRATPCESLELLEYEALRQRLTTTTWSQRCGSILRRRPISANEPPISKLVSVPLLGPTWQGTQILVVVRRSELLVVGWKLDGRTEFDGADVCVVSTLLPLLQAAASQEAAVEVPQQGLETLTPRETDVLLLVAQGLTATAAARRCGISARTVHKHLEHAYRKIGCHDRVSAVHYLTRAGLLTAGLAAG